MAGDLAYILLEDEDPLIRRNAAIGLGKIRVSAAKDALILALSDNDFLVRKRAVHALGKTWGHNAIEPLGEVLLSDPDPRIRRDAALKLGRIFSEDAYRALEIAQSEPEAHVRRAIMAGLERLEDY